MGYTTEFTGKFDLDKPLTLEQAEIIMGLSDADDSPVEGYCQWVPSCGGKCLEWDGGEKFYRYVEWLRYIISGFLIPWGIVLSGGVEWQGEESCDRGKIVVADNVVKVFKGRVVYAEELVYDETETGER
jgi:hypothetical protein